ncbi:MAG: hypothetical protein ACOCXQ_03635 [Patescibacteria group bacterium]
MSRGNDCIHQIATKDLYLPHFRLVLHQLQTRYPDNLLAFLQDVWRDHQQSHDTLLPEGFQFEGTLWLFNESIIHIENPVQLQIVLTTTISGNQWIYITLDLFQLTDGFVQARLWVAPRTSHMTLHEVLNTMLDCDYGDGLYRSLLRLAHS